MEIKNGNFYHNGQKMFIYSGAMHYFRIPEQYWEDRLYKLKAAGLNTVETYVCWNLHEKKIGEYDFSNMLNIRKFIQCADKLGLYVIIRPGPFICAEFDSGALPAFLYADKNIHIRCNDVLFLGHIKRWYKRLFSEIYDLQCTRGGNIIAMQVENEYGSYGNDKEYIRALYKIMIDNGAETFMFTADGARDYFVSSGSVSEIYEALTFGNDADIAFDCLNGIQDGLPKTCMEYWDGWFNHWGEKSNCRDLKENIEQFEIFLKNDYNFNLYMFHGGTNFGFTAGANFENGYQPITTSYDYCAPLGEYGNYTPYYFAIRERMLKKLNISEIDLPLPSSPQFQNIGKVCLTEYGSLLDNLSNISVKYHSPYPLQYSEMNMTCGYVFYSAEFEGKYSLHIHDMPDYNPSTSLFISNLHDRGYVYVNDKYKGVYYRNDAMNAPYKHEIKIGAVDGKVKIDILVEAMGGINYGNAIGEHKGLGNIQIGRSFIFNWDCYAICIDSTDKINFNGNKTVPCYLKGYFKADKRDCFVDFHGFTKGFIVVNGHNLGRYWNIGPQRTLYLPGCWLYEDKNNEIVIFEQEHFECVEILITDKPNYD